MSVYLGPPPKKKNPLKIRGGGVDRCSTPPSKFRGVTTYDPPPPLFGAPDASAIFCELHKADFHAIEIDVIHKAHTSIHPCLIRTTEGV